MKDSITRKPDYLWFEAERHERRLFDCDKLLQRQNGSVFIHSILMSDGSGFITATLIENWRGLPRVACASSTGTNIHTAKFLLCFWWEQGVFIYYELLKPHENIKTEWSRAQFMKLSWAQREQGPQIEKRLDKVMLQQDNDWAQIVKLGKGYLKRSNGKYYLTGHIRQILGFLIITFPFDGTCSG